jgi:hypothetical protein
MKKLKLSLVALLAVFSMAGGILLPATYAIAADKDTTVGLGDVKKETCTHTGGEVKEGEHGGFQGCENVKNGLVQTIQRIINILLFIIGIIAVVVLVIAGIMYATSGGNAEQTNKAKNAILYAVIGIIVAVMAYAIVGFVTQNIK